MLKGTSASAGIGIGKAVIVEETELIISKTPVEDAEAEKAVFSQRSSWLWNRQKLWQRIWQQE